MGPLGVHPDWNLAAWAVDRNGSVPNTRAAAVALIQASVDTLDYPVYRALNVRDFYGIHRWSLHHAVSMIAYHYFDQAIPPSVSADGKLHPMLRVWASGQLWKFGLESRTSKLGVVVMAVGWVVVLIRPYFGCWSVPSPLDLIVEALRFQDARGIDPVHRNSLGKILFQFSREGDRFFYELRGDKSLRRRTWSSESDTLSHDGPI